MTEGTPRSVYLEKQLSIGVQKYLGKKRGIRKVVLNENPPTDRHTVLSWEQRNTCFLPEDLKNFYLSSNGFDFSWSVHIESTDVPIGKMHIHPITQVNKLNNYSSGSQVQPSLTDLETDSDDEEEANGRQKPKLCGSNGIFELDDCNGYGKVCLVFKKKTNSILQTPNVESDTEDDLPATNTFPDELGISEGPVEVWFLDRSMRWHFLADSFLAYFRLMLMHLGLPQWQYAFTDIGLSLQAKQWFNMYAPIRLEVDIEEIYEINSPRDKEKKSSDSQLDINRVFKGKSDKKKQSNQNSLQGKKKPPVSSARSQSSLTGKSASSSSQSSMKASR